MFHNEVIGCNKTICKWTRDIIYHFCGHFQPRCIRRNSFEIHHVIIVLYFLHSTSVLSFYIDVVLTLSFIKVHNNYVTTWYMRLYIKTIGKWHNHWPSGWTVAWSEMLMQARLECSTHSEACDELNQYIIIYRKLFSSPNIIVVVGLSIQYIANAPNTDVNEKGIDK